MAAFQANFAYIQAENAKNHTFKLGLNTFADLSHEEFRLTRLGLSRPNTSQPWDDLPQLGTAAASGASLPEAVDWRKAGAMTPVGDQGSCGACWTFAAAGALSAAWQIQTGSLLSFSKQQLLDCTGGQTQGCRGGAMNPAFAYATRAGLCSAASYPYRGEQGSCLASQTCDVILPPGSVVGYRKVRPHHEAALMEAVAQQPVAVGIEAEGRAFQFYKNGIFSHSCGTQPNHGVLLVGYGVQSDGTRYWLLKNSWGPGWGEAGYFKLLREPSGLGQCGVMVMPSLPVVDSSHGASPPLPPATSGPTPAPGGPHRYGAPPCLDGEHASRLYGGVACVPKCGRRGKCPGGPAPGVLARPQCVLRERSAWSRRYCALVCSRSSECATGASCAGPASTGVCVYPESAGPRPEPEPPRRLSHDAATLLEVLV